MNQSVESITPVFRKFLGMNWALFLTMMGLLIFGITAVYSASWMRDGDLSDKWYDQAKIALFGITVYFAAGLIDYKWLRWAAIPIYLIGLGLLVVVAQIGIEVNDTRGWLKLPGLPIFQPSQVAMAGGILMMAVMLSSLHKLHRIFRNHFLRMLMTGIAGGIPFLMVLKQGDFGSALMWMPVIGAMFLVGSIPFRYLIVIVLCGTLVLPFGYFFYLKPYQKARITTQIDMLRGKKVDIRGAGYSAHNNLLAIATGHFSGKGFKATDSVNYQGWITPETAINDFIFAVLAEEHGFLGATLMLTAFLLLLLLCLFVAFYSRDMLGRLIVVGVVGLLFAHIYQNVGMNLLLMPITGIPLPLISYGGTFLAMILLLLGIVQSVWVHRNDRDEAPAAEEEESKLM